MSSTRIRRAAEPATPVVLSSPHSGMTWPPDFTPAAPRAAILSTWDAWVDALWGDAPDHGATVVAATFPRAYIDPNRAEDDLDPDLLDAPWPTPLSPTAYSQRGMGLVRRLALPDVPMYDAPLPLAAVRHRLEAHYRPFRAALAAALDTTHTRFGAVWHLDCHSMKSRGNRMNVDAGAARPDFVVSDRHGTTGDPTHTHWIADWLAGHGFAVQVNDPYQGGDLVRTFGAPTLGRHSVQVEINRACYMDETAIAPHDGFDRVRALLGALVQAFGARVRAECPAAPDAPEPA
jgi:N-formylglutamate deformylase